MPKTDRPSRAQGRLIAGLLKAAMDGASLHPDMLFATEREAVTCLHTWAHGAPPKLDARPQPVRNPVHGHFQGDPEQPVEVRLTPLDHLGAAGGNGEPIELQVGRLADWLMEHAPEVITDGDGAIDCALRLLDAQQANLDALRAEVARLSGLLDEAGTRYESMRERRNRAREHAVAAERERDLRGGEVEDERRRAEQAEAERDEARANLMRRSSEWEARAAEGRQQVAALVRDNQVLRESNVELTTERDAARRIATSAGRDLDDLRRRLDRAGVTDTMLAEGERHGWLVVPPNLMPTPEQPVELRVEGPGLVTFDGKLLRVDYDTVTLDEPASPQPDRLPTRLDDDPRRPSRDHYPDDGITLTYREVRQLIGLHLDGCGSSVMSGQGLAAAMREGESPLRLAEVLDR